MNTDSPWGEVRWQERHSSPPSNGSTMATSTLRPLATDRREDNRFLGTQHNPQIDRQSHAPQAQLHYPAPQRMNAFRTHSDAHNSLDYVSNVLRRPHASGTASPQPKLETPRTGSISERTDWQINKSRRASELPLSLETIGSTELPSIRTPERLSPSNQSTLLPSFSSLQRSAYRDDSSKTAPETVSKPVSPTCRGCVDKKSAIDDIALAVTGLDETVQMYGRRYRDHRPERPRDCSLRTAQWVLDCLKNTQVVLQESIQPTTSGYLSHNRPDQPKSILSRSTSPPGTGKRHLDRPETDESHFNKRLRTNSHIENHLETAPMFGHLDEKRRASESLQRTHPSRNYSPTLSDSWASSVHPHQHSPGFRGRSPKPLPSPSSMAATSHRASLSGLTVQPERSSTTVNHPPLSIHAASTSTAASQHISDLQHQVTLKSLALQTIQSEYTSLLQKFQRDRLKSQTFEKKTAAADQEVNELTTRNEELTEQVKTLGMQLEDSEKKRETERADAVREKEQWGRMLEMSGRLQAKSADDRQKLVQEKTDLQQRLLIRENEAAISASKKMSSPDKSVSTAVQNATIADTENKTATEENTGHLIALQRDNHILQTRANMLRSTLERVEGHYASMMEKRREMLELELAQIPGAIALALQEDGAFPKPTSSRPTKPAGGHDLTGPDSMDLSSSKDNQQSHNIPESAAAEARSVEKVSVPSTSPTTTGHTAGSNENPQTPQSNATATASKNATNPKLKAVPLPKWQPPGASTLRTEPLPNNQRRPSGPATPYPGSETSQWHSLDPKPSSSSAAALPSPSSKSSPPSNSLLPLFAMEKSPARDYTPQYAPPPAQSSSSSFSPIDSSSEQPATQRQQQQPVAAAMPPPPRPGAGGGLPSSSMAASWRPSL